MDRLPFEGPDPSAAYKHGWRLAAATILERYPVIIPDRHPFENEYLTQRFLAEQRVSLPAPAAMFLSDRDIAEGRSEPDFSDGVSDAFVPAPRVTEADKKNDTRSLKRALAERLYFVVKHTDGAPYRFPQTLVRDPGEDEDTSLVKMAERAFRAVTLAQHRPPVYYISHRPACHLEHIYPLAYQQKHEVYGVKIFFYRAVLLKGEIPEVRNAVDYRWARDCELEEMIGSGYYEAIKPMLFGVGPSIDFKV